MKAKAKQISATPGGTTVTGCTFVGLAWDAKAVEAVTIVAQGLFNLTKLFEAQNIKIGPMLQIGSGDKEKKSE